MGFFARIWDGLRALAGLILPVFASARDFPWLGKTVRWTLHLVLVGLILILLWWIGVAVGFEVIVPRLPIWLRTYWLPISFLIIYVIAWLTWWLWKLLLPEASGSYFPDLDAAWEEAMAALAQTGIGLTDAPLYLVLGRCHYGEYALFHASKMNLRVNGVPNRDDAPIRVFAHPDGIYVTCCGASLLGQQAEKVSQAVASPTRSRQTFIPDVPQGESSSPLDRTLQPGGLSQDVVRLLQKRERGEALSPQEERMLRILSDVAQDSPAAPPKTAKAPTLIRNQSQIEITSARLQHLCGLINRDRRPFCPINGVVVLVSWLGMEADEVANQLANFCRQDLATAHRAFQLHFPTLALVCDMEWASGFREFLKLLPAGHIREQRVGQRFPLLHDLDPRGLAEKLEDLARFICRDGAIIKLLYRMFRIESPGKETLPAALASNTQIAYLLAELQERHGRLGRFLARGIGEAAVDGVFFGGCYLAATGPEPEEQAFVPGFFERLSSPSEKFDENVSWTPTALDEDAIYHRWSRNGYVVIAVLLLAVIGIGAWIWWPKK